MIYDPPLSPSRHINPISVKDDSDWSLDKLIGAAGTLIITAPDPIYEN